MTLRISVSDSEEEDEITQLNLPEIENKEAVIEEEDIKEQGRCTMKAYVGVGTKKGSF